MFARQNDNDNNYRIFHDDGDVVTILPPEEWPIVWPVDSDVSAHYEYPEGIELDIDEYQKIAAKVPVED